MSKILFIDRDGVLVESARDEPIELTVGVIPGLLKLRDAGFEFVLMPSTDEAGTSDATWQHLLRLLGSQGIRFRPGNGALTDYLRDRSIDLSASAMVGDRDTDMQFAVNLGVRGFRLASGHYDWPAIAHILVDAPRTARIERTTNETRVRIELDLDRSADPVIATGLGFFDHMLEQLAKHAGIALSVACAGDLQIDEHHTVEDCALALGSALREALGDKRGLARYGFTLPMDESLASAAVDFSGRACFVFEGRFPRERVGDLPTELVAHFFRSLCDTAGLNLHLTVRGDNAHHMVEACFKAVARALRQALRREGIELPSTKGVL
jgi:imidazoleglycerol-phosphate dehydratase/histidinol-phosphatase